MKKKLKEELKSKGRIELQNEAEKREKELADFVVQVKSGRLKNTSLLRAKRDELAVIKTFLGEKVVDKKEEKK